MEYVCFLIFVNIYTLSINAFSFLKEPAYTPQVEAISPTLPSEEGRCDSPMRLLKENILNNINRLDKEINQVESQVSKLQKKMVSSSS